MMSLPAAERAYTWTKDRILRGELAGGELLSEVQVGDTLAISRTPVHEAFLRLDAERLLTLAPRRGAVVVAMSASEARDVLEMREAIESAAAARVAADRVDPKRLAEALDPAIARQRAALDGEAIDLAAFVAADDEFHTAVVTLSGNRTAAHLFDLLRDRQQRLRHQLLSIRDEHLHSSFADHQELAGRLHAHDAAGYAESLRRHVARHQGAL